MKVAWQLGELIGVPLMVDIWEERGVNMNGVQVKVRIDPSKSLPMGVFIPLHNGSFKRIPCTPERVFRVCEQYG